MATKTELRQALEGMVWEFAHRTVKSGEPILSAGGMGALKDAFAVLGWSDPKVIEDMDGVICDVLGCSGWVEAQGGMWPETGYWCLCVFHAAQARRGIAQPPMKQRAIKREENRDPVTGCLHD